MDLSMRSSAISSSSAVGAPKESPRAAAALTAAALLAKEGKKVSVIEASRWLGGRGTVTFA